MLYPVNLNLYCIYTLPNINASTQPSVAGLWEPSAELGRVANHPTWFWEGPHTFTSITLLHYTFMCTHAYTVCPRGLVHFFYSELKDNLEVIDL